MRRDVLTTLNSFTAIVVGGAGKRLPCTAQQVDVPAAVLCVEYELVDLCRELGRPGES